VELRAGTSNGEKDKKNEEMVITAVAKKKEIVYGKRFFTLMIGDVHK